MSKLSGVRIIPLIIVLALILGSAIQARALASDWVSASETTLSSSDGYENNDARPNRANLCEGEFGISDGTDPGWVPISGQADPEHPSRAVFTEIRGQLFYGPAQINQLGGRGNGFVTHTDALTNHFSHDFNAFLTLDKPYRHLLGDGNFNAGEYAPIEVAALEVEWENGGLPRFAFPAPGDRMTVWGHHIWDCGHGMPDMFRSEIHPAVGWVAYRQTADQDALPQNGKQLQDPWIWYEDTDLRGMSVTLPTTALKNTPVQASVADVFFSTYGGYAMESINGCEDTTIIPHYDTDDSECHKTEGKYWVQPLLNQDYSFFIPAPPKDFGVPALANLVWEAEDRCAEVPSNPANNTITAAEDSGGADLTEPDYYNIGSATCNTIPETVEETVENGQPGLRITINAASSGIDYPSNSYLAYAKRWKLAWDYVPAPADRAKTYRVDFGNLLVWDDAEPCGEDGEWLMSIRVNEQHRTPIHGSGDDGDAFYEDGALDDGKGCPGDADEPATYSLGSLSFTVNVLPGEALRIWEHSYDEDTTGNDPLPTVRHDEFGPTNGYVTRGLGKADQGTEGAHQITYAVTDISPVLPVDGTLWIKKPSYGPNADTGPNVTRVSGQTEMIYVVGAIDHMEYRLWKDGAAAPTAWFEDATVPYTVVAPAELSDGTYTIEYASVSDKGVVGTRAQARIQLDRTAPTLSMPANMVLEAINADGAPVSYSANTSDNFPGPVTLTCTLPSGSFLPTGSVTDVSCTATDAVGNTSTKTFTVEVVSPFGDLPDFVLLGTEWVTLGNGTIVESGNVGAFNTSAGVPQTNGAEVLVRSGSRLNGGAQIAAQTVRIDGNVQAGDAFYVDSISVDPSSSATPRSGYVPLFKGMPLVPNFSASTNPAQDRKVQGAQNAPLAAGIYRDIDVKGGAVLHLAGGDYYIRSLDVGKGAQLRFDAPTRLHIVGRLKLDNDSRLLPAVGSGLGAQDLVIYVTGSDLQQGNGLATASRFGQRAEATANVYVVNGTLSFASDGVFTGGFLGRRVDVSGSNNRFTLNSAFDVAP